LVSAAAAWAQSGELKTAEQVLDRYKQVLGGVDAIQSVQSETDRAELERPGGKIALTIYRRPFKVVTKAKLPDGSNVTSGFNGQTAWTITAKGASIDSDVPLESNRRDADLQYSLHQPDYFSKLELAGIADFEGHRCYWLHGTTHWGKDNNQFYDVETGLLAGYRYQSDVQGSKVLTTLLFEDYKRFGGPLVAAKSVVRTAGKTQTFTLTSVSYEPIDESVFELPEAVKALLKTAK
jgi:hypothetical protein